MAPSRTLAANAAACSVLRSAVLRIPDSADWKTVKAVPATSTPPTVPPKLHTALRQEDAAAEPSTGDRSMIDFVSGPTEPAIPALPGVAP